ncbi:hypothetical protein [Luteococcus sp.]|uniref:hypothetical protein n=1 Tax=Luteococcus sp. TaxID=1969402 RepID=UPI003735943A
MVMLIADGGQMTVGRRAGTFVYGSFQVILPEGREKQQEDNRLQDGYISRPPGQTRGRFDITFVRADATVDLGANVSDLETVIDTAQKRVAGDTFFERDITGPGLGRWRPGRDYDTGDLIDVLIWGKVMELPVTSIDMTSGDHGRAGWRVHVGGQLISDAATLRRHNDDLAQQIARERQERLAQLDRQRDINIAQAQSTASAAQEAAQAATTASTAATAAATAATNASAANATAGDALSRSITALQTAQVAMSRDMARFLWADRERSESDAFIRLDMPRFSTTARVRNLGGWSGQVLLVINYNNGDVHARGRHMSPGSTWTESLPVGTIANGYVIYQVRTGAYSGGESEV